MDSSAADPRIDELRAKIVCEEEKSFSVDYHDPEKRSISNAITIELKDGTVLNEVEIEYPVGHKRRRVEGTPLLMNKFKRLVWLHCCYYSVGRTDWVSFFRCRHLGEHFDAAQIDK